MPSSVHISLKPGQAHRILAIPDTRQRQRPVACHVTRQLQIMNGLVLTALLLGAVLPCGVLGQALKTPPAPDHSLNQAGPLCIGRFYNISQKYYSKDEKCTYQLQQAFAAVSKGQCPTSGTDTDSPVQKCLGQSKDTVDAWTDFVRNCPVLNVKNRKEDGGRESTRYFSCFQDFKSVDDFQAYASGSIASSGGSSKGRASAAAAVVPLAFSSTALVALVSLGFMAW